MAVFRCKMCGGNLEVINSNSICVCEFCGTQQTLPRVQDENLKKLFNRANVLRMKSEFDKAADIYEKILHASESEAEAYWGLILCKFGIEYVEDPVTFKWVPTCHRASYEAITVDDDYKSALEYADPMQKIIYEQQAKEIEEIQKGIFALVQNEKPYDVFICYKETDESGQRTMDSVIANDIYHLLTQEGFKVFYAAITLEDKLGQEYEPYIFSALNTSKVMIAIGTKPEYFNAVWVKNEWSRFLKSMRKDHSKMLIPCYRDMDAYELPKEFAYLQAQDMSRIGFANDIVRGIKKVVVKEDKAKTQESVVIQQSAGGTSAATQIKRGNMALEDHDWDKADSFFEEALNLDPECAEAYVGKLLARDRKPRLASWVAMQKEKYSTTCDKKQLEACPAEVSHIGEMAEAYAISGYLHPEEIQEKYVFNRKFSSVLSERQQQKVQQNSELKKDKLLSRVLQYAKGETSAQVEAGLKAINATLDSRINQAKDSDETNVEQIKKAYAEHVFATDRKVYKLYEKASEKREADYQSVLKKFEDASNEVAYSVAASEFDSLNGYKESTEMAKRCREEITKIQESERKEKERLEAEAESRAAIAAKKAVANAKMRKKIIAVVSAVAVATIAVAIVMTKLVIPNGKYNDAMALKEAGKYEEAIAAFRIIDRYKDSAEQIEEIIHSKGYISTLNEGKTFLFGTYGNESIVWRILSKEEGKILIISEKGLDAVPYNDEWTDVTWESCSLRKWLNSDFINKAFSDSEKVAILTSDVKADKNPEYDTILGNDTRDQIFLLSIAELNKYFDSEFTRLCYPTDYAIGNGAWTKDAGACCWWLRSSNKSTGAASVITDGSTNNYSVDSSSWCIRPALWLDVSDL